MTYRAIGRFDSLDLDIVYPDHFAIKSQDTQNNRSHLVTVYPLRLRNFEGIAELQVSIVALEGLLGFGLFLGLMNEELAGEVFHGYGVERFAVQRQVIVLYGEIHLEVALDVVGPFMDPMPFALQSEGARRAVKSKVGIFGFCRLDLRYLCGNQEGVGRQGHGGGRKESGEMHSVIG